VVERMVEGCETERSAQSTPTARERGTR
jgi:hypothetical protein